MAKYELNFTKAALLALAVPSEGKRAYYRDSKTRGLMFAITDRGTRSYVFYRKIDGSPERILIGRFEDLSIEQARNRAAEFNAMIANGQNPAERRRVARAEMTLSELFNEYIERHANVNVKHVRNYASQFRMYFSTNDGNGCNLAGRKLSRITKADIALIHGKISKEQPTTANRVLAMISSVFGWAIRVGLWDKPNPAQGIKKNREWSRSRFLLAEELPYFFEAVAADRNAAMRDYLLLSLLTGQRQANVLAMRWSEVDFNNAIWRIPVTKNGEPHVVPLTPEAITILEARKEAAGPFDEYVLPSNTSSTGHLTEPKGGWKRVLLRAELYRLLDALALVEGWDKERQSKVKEIANLNLRQTLGEYQDIARTHRIDPDKFKIPDLRMHDLRRTLASWQAQTGANISIISKTLNHAHVKTTAIYARLAVDPVRKAMETANRAMCQAGGLVAEAQVVEFAVRKF